MKVALIFCAVVSSLPAWAGFKFSFSNEELSKIIETYSRATGQKFVIDPGVRGKATITSADNVSNEEAFNLLSSSLAINGYAISTQGDTMIIKNARNIQRDLVETVRTLPALKPERMITYIRTMKNVPATTINRDLRILPSKDGELSVFDATNQIIMTDWISNLYRVESILKEVDIPHTAPVAMRPTGVPASKGGKSEKSLKKADVAPSAEEN